MIYSFLLEQYTLPFQKKETFVQFFNIRINFQVYIRYKKNKVSRSILRYMREDADGGLKQQTLNWKIKVDWRYNLCVAYLGILVSGAPAVTCRLDHHCYHLSQLLQHALPFRRKRLFMHRKNIAATWNNMF